MEDRARRIGKADVDAAVRQAVDVEAQRIRGIEQDQIEAVSGGDITSPQTTVPTGTAGMWPTGDSTQQQTP